VFYFFSFSEENFSDFVSILGIPRLKCGVSKPYHVFLLEPVTENNFLLGVANLAPELIKANLTPEI